MFTFYPVEGLLSLALLPDVGIFQSYFFKYSFSPSPTLHFFWEPDDTRVRSFATVHGSVGSAFFFESVGSAFFFESVGSVSGWASYVVLPSSSWSLSSIISTLTVSLPSRCSVIMKLLSYCSFSSVVSIRFL